MTNKNTLNKEDVPATVAGFYYQALLACYEITQLANNGEPDTTKVSIERGADVKTHRVNGEDTSIEAKFYGSNFTSKSETITHSIFNFYKNAFNVAEIVFCTNVAIEDDDKIKFSLKDWCKINDVDLPNYRKYIKRCLLIESVKRYKRTKDENGTKIKTPFEKYIEDNPINGYKQKQKYYDKILDDTSINLQDCIEISLKSEAEENEFIRKIKFRFSDELGVTKVKAVSELKTEICNNIDDRNKDLILNVLIDSFLQTTVDPTSYENQSLKKESISIEDFKTICSNAKESDIKIINQNEIKEFIERINSDEEDFITALNSDYREEENPKKDELLTHYKNYRYNLLKEISNTDDIESLKRRYSIKNDGSVFQFIDLIRYFSIISTFKGGDCILASDNHNELDNLKIDNDKYCYKYSSIIKTFQNFQHRFISETYDRVDEIKHPIIADVKYQRDKYRPCQSTHSITIPTDICNIQQTEKLAAKYRNLSYKCTGCILITGCNNDILSELDDFFNCGITKKESDNV